MTDKFKVYAQTRSTRQTAGDVASSLPYNDPERLIWEDIERKLSDLEILLEHMNLK